MQLTHFDKADLVAVARSLGVYRGDDARTKKAEFIELLERQPADLVIRELEKIRDEPIQVPDPVEKNSGKKATDPIQDALDNLQSAIQQGIGSNVDEDKIRQMIREEIADRPPRLIFKDREEKIEIPEGRHANTEKLLTLYAARVNTYLHGPSGTGKSHAAEVMAKDLGVKFASQSCSIGMNESAFAGWLLPLGDTGQFVYVPSQFVEIYENGGIFLIDEIDAADPNLLVFFNMALGNGGFFLPQRHDNPYVKRHPDCWIIAAGNTLGDGADQMYAGREQQDAALLERFRAGFVQFDYDEKLENTLFCEDLLNEFRPLREKIEKHGLNKVVSMHFLKSAQRLLENGASMDMIRDSFFANWSQDERELVK